jgi:uncharacterized glyoxalase superfamily protein PhnB
MKIPSGYHMITPYFTVANADALIALMTNVLAGTVIKEARHPDGKVQHARVRIGDSVVMLNEQTETYPSNVSQMHLNVSDVEGVYLSAIQAGAGASSVMEPNVRPHGDKMAGVKDPCGNVW